MIQTLAKAAVLGALILCGCNNKKRADSDNATPTDTPTMPAAERERGLRACRSYIQRLCDCGKTQPDLKKQCDAMSELPEELRLQIAATASQLGPRDRANIERSARKIIKKCIEGDARLDPSTCPRIP